MTDKRGHFIDLTVKCLCNKVTRSIEQVSFVIVALSA